jgi:peptidoglycan hydrolase-like protein with peptidoglycan-binding domain
MVATAALSLAQQPNHPSNNAGAQEQQTQNDQNQNQPNQNQQSQNEQSATAPMQVSKSEIRNIQQKLDQQGHHAGRQDGIIGPETTAALRDFQKQKGLQATGQIDQQTLRALGVSTANQNSPGYGSSNKDTSAQGANGQGQPGASKGH